MPSNRWVHLAASYDGATMSYYLDGVPAGSVTCNVPVNTWNNLHLGAYAVAKNRMRERDVAWARKNLEAEAMGLGTRAPL